MRAGDQATGLYFRTPKGVMQRYDPAPGGGHWYAREEGKYDGWHAFRESDVKVTRASRKAERLARARHK